MITVNSIEIKQDKFPDGTSLLLNVPIPELVLNTIDIVWKYENDSELLTIIYLVNHYRQVYAGDVQYNLYMPYIPNARMDRVKSTNEVFTLKWFAKILNGLHFDRVHVLDAHSNVSLALIDNVVIRPVDFFVEQTIKNIYAGNVISKDNFVIYFPDNGAYTRYKDLECIKNFNKIYGRKLRDWKTGQILGLSIVDEDGYNLERDLSGKTILMIDDIISYGGTFYHSVKELLKYNPSNIYTYATHVEPNSLWDENKGTFCKCLDNNEVKKLFTTDSIYNLGSSDKVLVFKTF